MKVTLIFLKNLNGETTLQLIKNYTVVINLNLNLNGETILQLIENCTIVINSNYNCRDQIDKIYSSEVRRVMFCMI